MLDVIKKTTPSLKNIENMKNQRIYNWILKEFHKSGHKYCSVRIIYIHCVLHTENLMLLFSYENPFIAVKSLTDTRVVISS